jgi:N-acyl-D-amino-acid deacylase
MLDILIKNGTVFDGTGRAGKKFDVAIEKGKVVKIAPNIFTNATQTINAQDRFVAPGFIDIQNHSDSYWTILDQPDQLSLLSQGITTIIMGNCGASLAPLLSPESIKTIQKWHSLSGININWTSLEEFLNYLSLTPIGVNVGTLAGHATLRRGLLGDLTRTATEEELRVMEKTLADALNQGALGLSMGLVYAHEVNSSHQELLRLAKLLKPSGKYLSVHLRSEASHILESLDEVIDLAASAQVPIKISHMKIRGENNWHLFESVMSKFETAFQKGVNITFDVYPYASSWSVLYTYLPKWAYEGGRAQILKTVNDPMSRRKILDYLKASGQDFGNVIVAEEAFGSNFVGKTIRQIGQNQSVSAEEAVLNVIAATKAQVIVFDHNLSDKQVEAFCASPLSFIATDGAGYSGQNPNLVHPRCFGAMPKFLRLVADKKLLKWEEAIQKLTSEPAKFLGISDRGVLAAGAFADVVIFDPLTIKDNADYKNPDLFSDGIDMVLVNGKLGYSNRKALNLNGQVIKR